MSKTKVIEMEGKFCDVVHLPLQLQLFKNKKNELGDLVNFRKGIKWLRVEQYGSYLYKESYDQNMPFKRVIISKCNSSFALNDITLNPAPDRKIALPAEKVDNLKKQMLYIPIQHHWFYNNIIADFDKNTNSTQEHTEKCKRKTQEELTSKDLISNFNRLKK